MLFLMLVFHQEVVLIFELIHNFNFHLPDFLFHFGTALALPEHLDLGSIQKIQQSFVDIEFEGSSKPGG